MVITEREVKVLGFDSIIEKLAALTASPMGKERALKLRPYGDYDFVEKMLRETEEARHLSMKTSFSPSTVDDIGTLVSRAAKGSMLTGFDLSMIMRFIKAFLLWPKLFQENSYSDLYPLLFSLAGNIDRCQDLENILRVSIDEEGSVLDSASSEISAIRRKKNELQQKTREELERFMRSEQYKRYLQEALVTIRSGRFVLPVKQEYRNNIAGVVHDQSASGATVFIEPSQVVQMQNKLVTLNRQEEQEIEKILYQLSSAVAQHEDKLTINRDIYGKLDFIVARGKLSGVLGGNKPALVKGEKQVVFFKNATHPLLEGDKIPLNLNLDGEIKTMVITGPNTGGKTVALKTIGLLTAMVQSGILIPAEESSKLSLFKQIRADIGDEQSIAQSLSTFSGHMKNIISITAEAGPFSMILFDELGAGTDPSEGSALAMSILNYLTQKGALTIATTHINELKLFAQVQEEMLNAAMEFDLETLEPTYRLLQGIPGQSNAFHISAKLGMPPVILSKAKSFMHRSHDQVESVIASLVENQQKYTRDSQKAAMELSRAELLMADLEEEQRLLKARKADILQEAREEAKKIIKRTKNSVDLILKEMKEIKNNKIVLDEAEKLKADVRQLKDELEPEIEDTNDYGVTESQLAVGQMVHVRTLNQQGEVISFDSDSAVVQAGKIKVRLPLNELRITAEKLSRDEKKYSEAGSGGYSLEKGLSISSSLDLRGLNLDESIPLVDKLLDNALWAGLNRVDIIHGKGTGKLRQGLRTYLRDHHLVSSIRSGIASEGGDGVTVIELRH